MKRINLALVAVAIAAFGAACADSGEARTSPAEETAEEVEITRRVLAAAGDSAARYGKQHLGHYRGMTEKDLRFHGLDVPNRVSLQVTSTHTSYCVRVMNRALPSIHPWRVGTVGSRGGEGSSADDCAM